MFEAIRVAIESLSTAVDGIDESRLTGSAAAELVGLCASAERKLAATRLMATRRVDKTRVWQRSGHRSTADWVAATTGTFIGQAVGMVETARRLDHLPLVAGELRSGGLSEERVRHITDAAAASPVHEQDLIAAAKTETVKTLRVRCREVKASADDELERVRSIHRRRYARTWAEPDGAIRLDAPLGPESGPLVVATLDAERERVFREARRSGKRESSTAYAADALANLITRQGSGGATSSPRATVKVVVDHDVLTSGVARAGQTCHVEGVGPIPAATAQALLSDSIVKVLVRKGGDVLAVSKATRSIPNRLRAALEVRDATCVIEGCDQDRRLEIDHVTPYAAGGKTALENLARLCHHHHFLKTYCGYRLSGSPGDWLWETPTDQMGPQPPPDG